MRKRIWPVLLLCLVLCRPAGARSQQVYARDTESPRGPYRPVSLQPYFGIAGFTGFYRDFISPRFVLGGTVDLPMAGIASIELEGFFQSSSVKAGFFEQSANGFGGGAGVRLTFLEGWFQPYAAAGLLFTYAELLPGRSGLTNEWILSGQLAGGALVRLLPWLRVGARAALLLPLLNAAAVSGIQFPLSDRDGSAANDITWRVMGSVAIDL